MPLARVSEILRHAAKHQYGVAAVNVFNYEGIKWVAMAAEKAGVPVIIQCGPATGKYIPLRSVTDMAKLAAERAAVPVGVHMDHAREYESAIGGLRDGFPSIMVDGSALPFEENIRLTAEVVRCARVFGADVEAELGHVGMGSAGDHQNAAGFTSPDEAAEFIRRTGADSLAVAVGNAHGAYKDIPNLDLERIRAIRKAVDVPLVLHGCSDIPDEQIRESVRLGMSKFNLNTEYLRAFYLALRDGIDPGAGDGSARQLMIEISDRMVGFLLEKFLLFNPGGVTW